MFHKACAPPRKHHETPRNTTRRTRRGCATCRGRCCTMFHTRCASRKTHETIRGNAWAQHRGRRRGSTVPPRRGWSRSVGEVRKTRRDNACVGGRPGRGGGGRGIRTLGKALQPYDGLANRCLQPLGHPSARAPFLATGAPTCQWRCCRSGPPIGHRAAPAGRRGRFFEKMRLSPDVVSKLRINGQ